MISGGHAIMLAVSVPSIIETIRTSWVREDPRIRRSTDDPHLTLAFVGRGLNEVVLSLMILAAEKAIAEIPREVIYTGRFSMFGYRKDHMVAVVRKDEKLLAARTILIRELRAMGIMISTDFEFSPHVTLGVSPVPTSPPKPHPEVVSSAVSGIFIKGGSDLNRAVSIPL